MQWTLFGLWWMNQWATADGQYAPRLTATSSPGSWTQLPLQVGGHLVAERPETAQTRPREQWYAWKVLAQQKPGQPAHEPG